MAAPGAIGERHDGCGVSTFAIVVLVLAVGYCGKRWLEAQSEVTALRLQVAQLKRRLASAR